jgi:RNA polymerase sigma-70 factor (ECF subfamily)
MDDALIEEILKENKIAQNELYFKYDKIIRNLLKCKYPKSIDVDDYVSEILIKVFLNLKSYDPTKSKFKTWVFNIVKNHMIDIWKSNSLMPDFLNLDECEYNNTSATFNINNYNTFTNISSTNDFENNDNIRYISTQVSPLDFSLLKMKYFDGYKSSEIGNEFNLTSTTVNNRINYLKIKLKKKKKKDDSTL